MVRVAPTPQPRPEPRAPTRTRNPSPSPSHSPSPDLLRVEAAAVVDDAQPPALQVEDDDELRRPLLQTRPVDLEEDHRLDRVVDDPW